MYSQDDIEKKLVQLRMDVDLLQSQLGAATNKIAALQKSSSGTPTPATQAPQPTVTQAPSSGDKAFTLGFDGFIFVGEIAGYIPVMKGLDGKFLKAVLTAIIPSPTGTIKVDVQRSIDGGSTWQTILNSVLTLASNTTLGTQVTGFAINTISDGHMLRAIIAATSATDCSGITCVLEYE